MKQFTLDQKKIGEIVVFSVQGYCNAEAGQELLKMTDEACRQRNFRILIDFSNCRVVNSPGISALIDVAIKVLDDFKGRLVLTALDDLKTSVFTTAGLLPLAETSATLEEGLKKIQS